MKLATLRNGTRDGQLIVVSRDNQRYALATDIAPNMQNALDNWETASPALKTRFDALCSGELSGEKLDVERLHSPLPRAYEWVDGSAFLNHVRLVRKARNAEPPKTLETDPLVYQGGSGVFLGPTEDIPLKDEAWGCDFEAELAVILGDTPQGTTAESADECVKLLMLVNDVTFRSLIPSELAKNFGFFCSKPATAFSPFAITPDELGGSYREGRVFLNMETRYNGETVGKVAAGSEMHFSFRELIAHISQTRAFTAGTILGSGTISNEDRAAGISCLAERRMIEIIETGSPKTSFMTYGDQVQIEMFDEGGNNLFGTISQTVTHE